MQAITGRLTLYLSKLGKLNSSSCAALTEESLRKTRRLFILDRYNNLSFLIDTGSEISVIPPSKPLPPSDYFLTAANRSKIETYGERTLTLNLKLRRPITWTFLIADVEAPIIGSDLLDHYNLLPDIRNQCLIDRETGISSPAVSKDVDSLNISVLSSASSPFQKILEQFKSTTLPQNLIKLPATTMATKHHILTKGPPIALRPRRLPPDRYAAAKKEFELLVSLGICRPSSSPWSSPLLL